MRVISFERKDGSSGVGVMTDDTRFVDANKRDAGLPDRLRALLARSDGLAHMRAGGTVEVEISGLGVLRNPIVADEPVAYRPET